MVHNKYNPKNPYIIIGSGILIAAGIITIILVERKRKRDEVSEMLRIIDSGEGESGTIADAGMSGGGFDRTLWRTGCGVVIENGKVTNTGRLSIGYDQAMSYAKQIWDAKAGAGLLGDNRLWDADNEGIVMSIFRSLKNKCDLSALSDAFYIKYNRDLLTYLQSFVNKGDNMNTLTNLIKALK